MAKDNREVVRGIRVLLKKNETDKIAKSVTLASGSEDEIAAMFTQKELSAMVTRGDLTGNWKSTKAAKKTE